MSKQKIAEKHNFSVKIKTAFIERDIETMKDTAQEIFDAGYELEDMNITPSVMGLIANTLMESGWAPVIRDENML